MGTAIDQIEFSQNEIDEFKKRLRLETKHLKQLYDSRQLGYFPEPLMGLEVEAWLMDQNFLPNPVNQEFLSACNSELIVEELSQFNFELNTHPATIKEQSFSKIQEFLETTWGYCQEKAEQFKTKTLLCGIHPLIRDQHLQPEWMSNGYRYEALNLQMQRLRKNKDMSIHIVGQDELQMKMDHIMLEAAATSIQVHLQSSQETFKRDYNASLMATPFCVALAANSPFLYGKRLWEESRIPLFEQALQHTSFRDKRGNNVGRVTFGTGYIRRSVLELFIENLDGYEPLIPVLYDQQECDLKHILLHNGTVWRWNRPIVACPGGEYHLRIEQRGMAAGPSLVDMVANMAFYIGLTSYLAGLEKPPEESLTFSDCRNNFYSAAHKGLGAKVKWNGKEQVVADVILKDLLSFAKKGLKQRGVYQEEINYYLDDIIYHRVLKGQNGSKWQRSFVENFGLDFQALTEKYFENQQSGEPVYAWKL